MSLEKTAPTTADEPPSFTINLSLPPEQRYLAVCAALSTEIAALPGLFDEVVPELLPSMSLPTIHRISKTLLRRLYDSEQTRELQGISMATGVEMYLLVAFNVLLDLFMGCSSGGAAVGNQMLHFRTLEWDMPVLRKVVVQLNFVRQEGGPVIARSITYAGFVGVLTAVKEGLSISLNFRPTRSGKGKKLQDIKYGWHLAMVLLGRRPSISSHLRTFLLPGSAKIKARYADVVSRLADSLTTTACYLTFCNGRDTTVIEKDRKGATIRSSDKFIVVTNNDKRSEPYQPNMSKGGKFEIVDQQASMEDIIEEAEDRAWQAEMNWVDRSRSTTVKGLDDVIWLLQQYPTINECTHYACVMNPTHGTIEWCQRWMKPVPPPTDEKILERYCRLEALAKPMQEDS